MASAGQNTRPVTGGQAMTTTLSSTTITSLPSLSQPLTFSQLGSLPLPSSETQSTLPPLPSFMISTPQPTFSTHSSSANTLPHHPFGNALCQNFTVARNNFLLWKSVMLPHIHCINLDGHLFGNTSPPPNLISLPGTSISQNSVPNPAYAERFSIDQLIVRWLLSSMTEEALIEVVGCDTARDVWVTLETLYNSQNEACLLDLKDALTKSQKGAMSISDYLALMKSYSHGLTAAWYPISSSELILAMLGGLGKDYESVIVNITARVESLSWPEVQAQLLTHERLIAWFNPSPALDLQIPIANISPTANIAFRAGSRPAYRPYNSFGGSPQPSSGRGRNFNNSVRGGCFRGRRGRVNFSHCPICQVCGKFGHNASICYHRFDSNYGNQISTPHVGSYNNSGSSAVHQASAYYASPETVMDPSWLADSGATSHMSSDLSQLLLSSEYGGSETLSW